VITEIRFRGSSGCSLRTPSWLGRWNPLQGIAPFQTFSLMANVDVLPPLYVEILTMPLKISYTNSLQVLVKAGNLVFSERELMFMFAICRRPSVCLSVCLSSVCRL